MPSVQTLELTVTTGDPSKMNPYDYFSHCLWSECQEPKSTEEALKSIYESSNFFEPNYIRERSVIEYEWVAKPDHIKILSIHWLGRGACTFPVPIQATIPNWLRQSSDIKCIKPLENLLLNPKYAAYTKELTTIQSQLILLNKPVETTDADVWLTDLNKIYQQFASSNKNRSGLYQHNPDERKILKALCEFSFAILDGNTNNDLGYATYCLETAKSLDVFKFNCNATFMGSMGKTNSIKKIEEKINRIQHQDTSHLHIKKL